MSGPEWRATYRLQFHACFTFDDAVKIVPYLRRLGVSHVYASPIQAARSGSTHGYDQIDPCSINADLGGEPAFLRFSDALRTAGMGLLLDIVPNHMAAHRSNPWWMAALASGPGSPAAAIFDIDWQRHPQVRQPMLDDTFAANLARGTLALDCDTEEGWLVATAYGEHAWPLRIEDTARLLDDAGLADVAQLWRADRSVDFGIARAAVRRIAGDARDRLDVVLARQDVAAMIDRQFWRPVHWRSGRDALSARRFFNITELVGVCVEQEEVFALTHRLPLDLLRDGRIDGLRIDHIDGLADPAAYCRRLRAAAGPEALIVVEKILGLDETLPAEWPVDGTTGYERLNQINRLFVSVDGYHTLAPEASVVGEPAKRLADAKRQLLTESFAAELEQLTEAASILAADDAGMEFAGPTLRAGLTGLLVHFPVYRSYLVGPDATPADQGRYATALSAIEAEGDPWNSAAARWLADVIMAGTTEAAAALRRRFQQLTGPLMAKGLEDTEFYRNVTLLSVNEVGGDPDMPAIDAGAFHAWAMRYAATRPRDLTPLATHDTKRGADARARINLLSLAAQDWVTQVACWRDMNAALRPQAVDGADEWLIYQTMFGAWPIDWDRLRLYLVKAMREAKRHTRWETPNETHEDAVLRFASALLEHADAAPFRAGMSAFVERMIHASRRKGIAQTVLQLTLPGLPDIYQGSEWWDLSLVDPDNRRPVDYAARNAGLEAPLPSLANDDFGLLKQRVTMRLLHLRQERPEIFVGYQPAKNAQDGWLAFTRGDGRMIVAVQTRDEAGDWPVPSEGGGWLDVLSEAGGVPGVRVLVRT